MGDEKCLFDWKFGCASKSDRLIVAGPVRITNIIRRSILYGDEKHQSLQKNLDSDVTVTNLGIQQGDILMCFFLLLGVWQT